MVMKILRKRKNMKLILWVVAIFIIPGFLIWGVGLGSSSKNSNYAATINREPITLRDFYKNLHEMEQRYREIFGDGASEILKSMNLERMVLENMVREKLLLQQAKKRRVKVFNSEIIEVIKADRAFLNEKGVFDQNRYKEIIASMPNEELRKIEDEIRKNLMLNKLREEIILEASSNISEAEVDEYIKNNQITDVDKASIRESLIRQKGDEAYGQWYESVKSRSKINIYLASAKPVELPDEQIEDNKPKTKGRLKLWRK
ncbi:SurA N-terminal domain-containing protein [bacterium]|nr:SurA N-terminal domain-containing protein [bacterium]